MSRNISKYLAGIENLDNFQWQGIKENADRKISKTKFLQYIRDNNLIYTDASNNNLGIGTTLPTEKIHVLGNARIEGNLTVNGNTNIINTYVLRRNILCQRQLLKKLKIC